MGRNNNFSRNRSYGSRSERQRVNSDDEEEFIRRPSYSRSFENRERFRDRGSHRHSRNRGYYDEDRSSYRRYDDRNDFGFNEAVKRLDPESLPEIKSVPYVQSESLASKSEEEINNYRKTNQMKISGNKQDYRPIMEFSDYEIPNDIMEVLNRMNITTPTPIQAQTWPIALDNNDMIGISKVGTKKIW